MGVTREKVHSPESHFLPAALAAQRDTRASQAMRRLLLLLNLLPPFLVFYSNGSLWAWAYAILVHGILLVGLFVPNSAWLGPVLRRLPTDQKKVWLTIDDGPSPDTIPLAEMLGSLGVSATFFLCGRQLAGHPHCIAILQAHGHSVAHHTWHHPLAWFWAYPRSRVEKELCTFAALTDLLEAPLVPAFRCPAGVKNPFLHSALQRHRLTLVGWTVRAYDGITCDIDSSLSRLLRGLRPGAILLMHEGKKDRSGHPASVALVRQLVERVQGEGYAFIATR